MRFCDKEPRLCVQEPRLKLTDLSNKPFLRIIALLGVPVEVPILFRPVRLPCGVPYGGGLMDRAASQSKGVEEDIEGVDEGDWR